ncbi:unnamed protein product (macronuclear) [Paramecium tetraurelia]|uniref:Uncharacterized protein n=1 Tax=Paramecium tetraurelia TaxID=5888 RepID=A0DEC5_PARTE|nr:uncharacterized protein GSPATT00016218001 [Paramecium tetraurelia]CAK81392.1 unnamed protein product [Paramecium tetraurelia]|eukprot:XP_001448789.1 hypothetical protein (macronuclear) [Paramecium tetraurelia strain d4-2]
MIKNSAKFKHNVPKSSTTSAISEFSLDESPLPNSSQFSSFTHAQTISAKLNRSSVYNQENIMFNTPRCLAVPFTEIEKDEVLSKSTINKQLFNETNQQNEGYMEPASFSQALIQQSKYTDESLKKISKIEKFLEKTKQKHQKSISILSSEDSPYKSTPPFRIQGLGTTAQGLRNKLDHKINRKFDKLMNELRIIRKNIQYFTAFDGTYAQSKQMQNNFISLKQQNGLIINNGTHLTRLELINDTFNREKVCNIHNDDSRYISFCMSDSNISNDMLITGSDQGNIMGWNLFKNQAYRYYGLNKQYNCSLQQHSIPTFITQKLNNIFVGTKNNELLVLDERMNERKCLLLTINKQKLNPFQANQLLSPLLPRFGSIILESPQFNPPDLNLLHLTSFKLDEELDSIKDDLIEQFPSFNQFEDQSSLESQYIKYIDVHDYNVVATMTDGFIHLDMRNPTVAQYSFRENGSQALKAMFTPGNPNNIIYAKQNSNRCLLWNVQKNQVLFHKKLESNPSDMTVAQEPKEVLFLHQDQNDSIITIYNNFSSKLKYCDELIIPGFNVQKILLDYQCKNLYGIGPYSLRTWNYYQQKEIDILRDEMKHQLDLLE